MPRTASPRRPARAAALFGLALAAAALPAGARASGPALEYGAEAEAHFVGLCAGTGAAPAACRCISERVQDRLGYPGFLLAARDAQAAFSRDAAPAGFSRALAGAQAACGAALPGTVTAAR